MPELPEVETIKKQLNHTITGQTIKKITILRKKSFSQNPRLIIGTKITSVKRRAKILIIKLSNSKNLLIHLKMTGQLVYDKSLINKKINSKIKQRLVGGHPTKDWIKDLPSSHTRVIIKLSRGYLYFNDMRVFGWIKVLNSSKLKNEFKNFGPDIIDSKVTTNYFYNILQSTTRSIKAVITDQKKLAGIGNIYANDALFCAKIHPTIKANTLSKPQSKKLLLCLKKVIKLGIKYGGATASDDKFVQATGLGGKYQNHFLVYEKKDKPCSRKNCFGTIKKIKLAGRGTYFCSNCQLI